MEATDVANVNLTAKVGRPVFGFENSEKVLKNVCDFDFKSQYPLIIYMLRIGESNFLGRPKIPQMPMNELREDGAVLIANLLVARDFIKLGEVFANLPNRESLIKSFSSALNADKHQVRPKGLLV